MSSTLRATFAGSSASSQPPGLPVSTAQKRQARVHTAPISMMVPVPAFQHSPMFGHFASSHTVARRCSRTMALTASKPAPAGARARSQDGLPASIERSTPARALMPSRMAVKPCGVTYFSPLRVCVSSRTTGIFLMSAIAALYGETLQRPKFALAPRRGARTQPDIKGVQTLRRPHVPPLAAVKLASQAASGYRTLKKWRQRKLARLRATKELRTIDADSRERRAIGGALDDDVAVKSEVTMRMMLGVGHEHEARLCACVNVGIQSQMTEIKVGPGIAVHDQKRPGRKQRQGIKNAAAGLERLGTLIGVADPYAIATAVTERAAQPITEPCEIDDDIADAGARECFEVIRDERPARDRQERFRQRVGQRAHALTAAGCQHQRLHASAAAAAAFELARTSSGTARRSRNAASSASSE